MTLPHTTHPGRRDVQAAFFQLVGRAHLTPRRLGDRQLGHRLLDLRHHPVLQDRLAPRDFLQRRLAALVVEFLEAVEAVAAVAHHPARRRHVAELLCQLQHAHLHPDYFLFLVHRPRLLLGTRGPYHRCQIKSWSLHMMAITEIFSVSTSYTTPNGNLCMRRRRIVVPMNRLPAFG